MTSKILISVSRFIVRSLKCGKPGRAVALLANLAFVAIGEGQLFLSCPLPALAIVLGCERSYGLMRWNTVIPPAGTVKFPTSVESSASSNVPSSASKGQVMVIN